MNQYKFQSEYATTVCLNPGGGITITQECDDSVIVISSKARAIEVANAILNLVDESGFGTISEDKTQTLERGCY